MHHRHFKRVGATALLAIAGLLGSLLIAPAAPAATINACQKKKGGTIRIVSSKTKCKATEKKIKWSTTGPAGKNGTNGTNGSNGSNGSNGTNGAAGIPGQPQKATPFTAQSDNGGFLTNIFTPVLTAGDISIRMACGNFIANILGLEASAPAGSASQTGMVATRTDDSATQNTQVLVQTDTPTTNTNIVTLVTNTSGVLSNKGSVTGTITSPTQTLWFHANLVVGTSPAPDACQVQGVAISIPR